MDEKQTWDTGMIETFLDANFSSPSSSSSPSSREWIGSEGESEVTEKVEVTEKEKEKGPGSGSVKAFAASLVQEIKVRPFLLLFSPFLSYYTYVTEAPTPKPTI